MRKDWIKIKNYYITHDISLKEIAKKYKVGMAALSTHCSKENWVELKHKKHDEISTKTEQKITKQEVDKKVAANTLHTELYNKGLEVANILLDNYLSDLKNGVKKTKATAYNLDFIMKAIANAQKGQRLSLNIGEEITENNEPVIHVINGVNIEDI